MTGDYSNNRRGMMTNDFSIGVSNGISSNLLNVGKKPDSETITPIGNKPIIPIPIMNRTGMDVSDSVRPPLYVPT